MSDLDWITQIPVAHRGLHDVGAGIIENSPSAIQAALDKGFAIEIDVQISKDGEAMVFHDFTLDRLTLTTGYVAAHCEKQLRQIEFKNTKDPMWSLSDLLQLVQGRVPLFVEIKSQWDAIGPLERRVVEVLQTYSGPVGVMSFDPHSIIAVKEIAPKLVRGLVVGRFADTDEWAHLTAWQRFLCRQLLYGFKARPDFFTCNVQTLPAIAPWIAKNLAGLPLLCWTVCSPQDRATASRWADQITFEGFVP